MASGQQVAEENVQRFQAWVASKTDSDFRQMVSRGVLSRTEIAAECSFAKSALAQRATHEGAPAATQRVDSACAALDAELLSLLKQENASLKAENAELRHLLGRYAVSQDFLSETGKLLG